MRNPTGKPIVGKEFIRGNFTPSPNSGSYLIPNIVEAWGLLDFYREARAAGFHVEPHEMPEYGLKGFVAMEKGHYPGRTSGPVSYEIYFVGILTKGVKLEPDEARIEDVDEWEALVKEHSSHEGMILDNDPASMSIRMICYCMAKDGKSMVRKFSEKHMMEMDRTSETIVDGIMGDENEH